MCEDWRPSAMIQLLQQDTLRSRTTFTEDLRAWAIVAGGRVVDLPVFPGYGALASVIVPAGATDVHLRAEPPRLPFAGAWMGLGLACWATAVWLVAREHPLGAASAATARVARA